MVDDAVQDMLDDHVPGNSDGAGDAGHPRQWRARIVAIDGDTIQYIKQYTGQSDWHGVVTTDDDDADRDEHTEAEDHTNADTHGDPVLLGDAGEAVRSMEPDADQDPGTDVDANSDDGSVRDAGFHWGLPAILLG